MPCTRHVYAFDATTGDAIRFESARARWAYLALNPSYDVIEFGDLRRETDFYRDFKDGDLSDPKPLYKSGRNKETRLWHDIRDAMARYRDDDFDGYMVALGKLVHYGLSESVVNEL